MPMASRPTSPGSASSQGSVRSYMREMSKGNGRSRDSEKRRLTVKDLYGEGVTGCLMQGRYQTDTVYAWFQKRHIANGKRLIDEDGYCRIEDEDGTVHEWKPPLGIRLAMCHKLTRPHIVNAEPWYVTFHYHGKRAKKYFQSLASAVIYVTTKAQYVDPHASIVSRHGFDIPAKLRGKIPRPWKWCPRCLDARKFRGVGDQTFFARIKTWDDKKQCYVWPERKLLLMECPVCGITNRNHIFRRSNQPWFVRKLGPKTRLRKKRR